MFARPATAAIAVALLMPGACGGDDNAAPDGGSEQSSLEVLRPPGDAIGLAFHGIETLRVLYSDPGRRPVAGAPVSFELVTSASEATGGSTVSASEAFTDGSGIATVDLVAGAERVNFRVQATAAGAPPALFYITVSDEGFTFLSATPEHAGFRAPDDFGVVELRLYRADELVCADLDIDAPPESVLPQRALAGFGEDVGYPNVGAGEAYTVIAWGSVDAGGVRLAAGCVELGARHVRPGSAVYFPLPTIDRMPALPPRMAIASTFDAAPLAAAVAAAGPDVWSALDCPLGRAQLALDCALDAEAPDGVLDCAPNGTSLLVADVQALRGEPDAAGCRPALASTGVSIDAVLEGQLGPPWPADDALAALLAARRAPLVSFETSSLLESGSGGALAHRLDRIAVSSGGATAELELVASDRPVVRQSVAMSGDPIAGRLSLGPHSFTLDYGRFAQSAFVEIGLQPAGLGDEVEALGSALYQSVAFERQVGCAAFSRVVCEEVGRGAACLAGACGDASAGLDVLLDAWWRVLDGPGYDLALSGSAPIRDSDADLVLDGLGLGDGAEPGAWECGLVLASGEAAGLAGTFTGAPSAP